MTETLTSESYKAVNADWLHTLFRTMSELGFTSDDAMWFCTRKQVMHLFKVVRGYSALTVLKPFDRYELSGEYVVSDELMTDERCHNLDRLFTRFGFNEADMSAVCNKSLLKEMLFLIREQAVLTTITHVIDCAAVNRHSDFMGCRGVRHTHKMEVVVWENPPELGRVEVETIPAFFWGKATRYLRLHDMNERVLDYLLEHPELIPEEWKQYWKVLFDATKHYSRAFMAGNPTYFTPCLVWDKKRGEWIADTY